MSSAQSFSSDAHTHQQPFTTRREAEAESGDAGLVNMGEIAKLSMKMSKMVRLLEGSKKDSGYLITMVEKLRGEQEAFEFGRNFDDYEKFLETCAETERMAANWHEGMSEDGFRLSETGSP